MTVIVTATVTGTESDSVARAASAAEVAQLSHCLQFQ